VQARAARAQARAARAARGVRAAQEPRKVHFLQMDLNYVKGVHWHVQSIFGLMIY
jgi:hypothetical protein